MPTPHKVETTQKAPQTPGKSASVHLEGFADAAPSPMTASTKPLETTTTTAAAPSASHKKSRAKSATGANNAESPVQKAREASNSLIQSALLSTLETSYTQLQQERDTIQTQLSTSLSTISSLKLENNVLKSAQEESSKSVEETMKRLREECAQERNRREEMEKKLKFSEERVDRLEGEGDSLRGEIRLVLCIFCV
jgi:nucleoprotein TPR